MRPRQTLLLAAAAAALLAAGAARAATAKVPGQETASGGAVYLLPQDHQLHSLHPVYDKSNDYMEWYYFTSFTRDVNTGEPWTLFWVLNLQGWMKNTQQPFNSIIFSAHNQDTGYFQNVVDQPPVLKTAGPAPGTKGFGFSMLVDAPASKCNVTYTAADEAWYFKGSSSNNKGESKPYAMDLKLKVYSPGYIGATAQGIETEGTNPTGDWNPETVYGLSYYTIAPQALITGTVKLANGKTITVRGNAWIEHQWGNFRGFSNLHSRYYWAWARLDNGDLFTLREWNTKDGQDKYNGPPDPTQSRFIYLQKLPNDQGFKTLYATGPSIKYHAARNHTIKNGQSFQLWGRLETPQGNFYLAPEFPDQQTQTAAGPYFWEGVKYIYKDPELKQRIGRMFGEHVEISNDVFKFVRQAPEHSLARPLNGGLPPLPADAAVPVDPKRPVKNVHVKYNKK